MNAFQPCGRTAGSEIRQRRKAICIDLGAGEGRARIAGAWIRNGQIAVVEHQLDGEGEA